MTASMPFCAFRNQMPLMTQRKKQAKTRTEIFERTPLAFIDEPNLLAPFGGDDDGKGRDLMANTMRRGGSLLPVFEFNGRRRLAAGWHTEDRLALTRLSAVLPRTQNWRNISHTTEASKAFVRFV
jgi:hypothetical protein